MGNQNSKFIANLDGKSACVITVNFLCAVHSNSNLRGQGLAKGQFTISRWVEQHLSFSLHIHYHTEDWQWTELLLFKQSQSTCTARTRVRGCLLPLKKTPGNFPSHCCIHGQIWTRQAFWGVDQNNPTETLSRKQFCSGHKQTAVHLQWERDSTQLQGVFYECGLNSFPSQGPVGTDEQN